MNERGFGGCVGHEYRPPADCSEICMLWYCRGLYFLRTGMRAYLEALIETSCILDGCAVSGALRQMGFIGLPSVLVDG